MENSKNDYLKGLANDKVSDLLLAIMFLFDAVYFAFINDSKMFLYISLIPLILDIIWCQVVLRKHNIQYSHKAKRILKFATYAIWTAIAIIVIIGIIR